METGPFASLAQIRILLIPVGPIRRSAFEKYAGLVRSFGHIRLGDIPPDPREDKNRFIPSPLSSGHLHLTYITHPPPSWHNAFSLFRMSSFPLGVIGIADSSQDATFSIVAQFKATLVSLFPPDSAFPFASKCFAFEEGEGDVNLDLGPTIPELVTIPSLMKNKQVYVGTLLAELCHDILAEFPSLVRTVESAEGMEAIMSRLLPTVSSTTSPSSSDRFIINPTNEFGRVNGHAAPGIVTRSSTFPELSTNGLSRGTGLGSHSGTSTPQRLGITNAKKRANSIGPSNGRLSKIIGDLCLLAGKLNEANTWYTEAISLFRMQQDSIWNASALEGQCIIEVLEAWSAGDSLHTSLVGNVLGDPWANISDKMGQAINLYSRATPTTPYPPVPAADAEAASIVLLYTDAVLRYSHFLFSIWSSKGWNPLSLSMMLTTGVPATFSPDRPSSSTLYRMTTLSSITRSDIAMTLSQAHGPFLMHLQQPDQIRIFSTLASLYSCIGFKRKEVLVLREVQAAIMDLIVCGRDENRSNLGRESFSNESKIHLFDRDRDKDRDIGPSVSGALGVRETEDVEGNISIVRLAKCIAEVYGVDITCIRVVDVASEAPTPEGGHPIRPLEPTDALMGRPHFGWPELQVGVVRETVAVVEALPDHASVVQFSLSTLKTLHKFLTANEQYHLYTVALRGISTLRRRGVNLRAEFWAEAPIVSIEVLPLPLPRFPSEHLRQDLERHHPKRPSVTFPGGPFLYHPGRKKATASQVVVQNESIEFVVTLRNPYMFDFDIQYLVLSTSGVPFHTQPVSVVIPPNSHHTLTLTGLALEPGTLIIRGCQLQLAGGIPREFPFPIADGNRPSTNPSSRHSGHVERVKSGGLDANPLLSASLGVLAKPKQNTNSSPPQFLHYEVVPEQPLLRIRRSSLPMGALVLYDGEISKIHLTIENISTLPVDFYRLAFDDSTIGPAQQSLADGNLSVAEVYETEYDLVHRPFFQWDPPSPVVPIEPGNKTIIIVSCLGKLGCNQGTIQLSYAHVDRPSGPSGIFHTRRITYPINVTVYHTLECDNLDIIPLKTYANLPHLDTAAFADDRDRSALLGIDGPDDYCLVSMDVSNLFGSPFQVSIERHQDDTPPASNTCLILPGSTRRLFLPIKRFTLSPEEVSKAIPTLSNRQFVVAKDRLTPEEEAVQRDLFWYREKLFQVISGQWIEPETGRTGTLSLRGQRLSLPMRDALRKDLFLLDLIFESEESGTSEDAPPGSNSPGASIVRQDGDTWYVKPYETVYLTTRVCNMTDTPRSLNLACSLVPPTLGEHALLEGSLTHNYVGSLDPTQSRQKSWGVCFVAEGVFEFRIDAVEVGEDGRPPRDREKQMTSSFVTAIVG